MFWQKLTACRLTELSGCFSSDLSRRKPSINVNFEKFSRFILNFLQINPEIKPLTMMPLKYIIDCAQVRIKKTSFSLIFYHPRKLLPVDFALPFGAGATVSPPKIPLLPCSWEAGVKGQGILVPRKKNFPLARSLSLSLSSPVHAYTLLFLSVNSLGCVMFNAQIHLTRAIYTALLTSRH